MKIIIVLLVSLILVVQVSAKDQIDSTLNVTIKAQFSKGSALRSLSNEIVNLLLQRQTEHAKGKVDELLNAYESIFDSKLKQYSFLSQEEFDEFNKTATQPFEWIDWGYAETLHSKATIEINRKEYENAYISLQKMESVAPCSAFALAEKGFVLMKLKKFDEALLAYQKSYDLTTKYKSQLPHTAQALRGQGVVLVDLNRLDEAEAVLNKSLEINPDSKVALGELAYIRSLRTKQVEK